MSDAGLTGLGPWLRPADAGHDGCWRVALGNPAPVEINEAFGSHRLMVRSGYCCGFHRTWTNYPHHHAYYEACLVLGGRGEYVHGGGRHRLVAGDVFLADPAVVHEISSAETRDLSLVFFTFQVQRAGSGAAGSGAGLLGAFLAGHRIHAPAQFHLFHYLPLLETTAGAGRNREFSARRAMLDLVLEMLASLTPAWAAPEAETAPSSPLDLALEYLQRNVAARLDVKGLAAYACASERTLRRLFRQHLGRSIQEEFAARQVHFAAAQLAAGLSPGEVARRLGLGDPASFTRLFKRGTGMTPAQYRKSHSGYTPPESLDSASVAAWDKSLAASAAIPTAANR